MDLIILGGNNRSPKNRAWVSDLANTLQPYFTSVYSHSYRHWQTKEKVINLDCELEALKNIIKEKQEYLILGKSAGVILTLKGINSGVFTPAKCIFIGTPVRWGKKHSFAVDAWFRNYSTPSLFIQESYDPAMLSKSLKKYLKEMGVANYQLSEIPGNDHDYENQLQLRDIIISFATHSS